MWLEQIEKPNDIKSIPKDKLPELAKEIRAFLIETISETGGHLASNLGTVELTIALHYVYNFPQDKLIWDVGHQSYTHKILTGRREEFANLRKMGGLSGFPKRRESECDCFNTGHSSTSLSAGIGFVKAREIKNAGCQVAAVIGDGSLTGGLAYEALNNASGLRSNFTMILNDNKMSISENIGGISMMLNTVRTAEPYINLKAGVEQHLNRTSFGEKVANRLRSTKDNLRQMLVPGKLFENLGITYLGPLDGHNIDQLIRAFEQVKKIDHAVLVHVLTEKGKGYAPAERQPLRFHGTEAFDIRTGEPKEKSTAVSYTKIFGDFMKKAGAAHRDITAITAAMPDGTGLSAFASAYPRRFCDVGIAEGHAVTMAAAMAAAGMRPVVAVYSSFLQRAYDEILHDVCMQRLHVVFAIDRAGIVGRDGETHQGAFDLSYLSMMPHMTVMAPKNGRELTDMLAFALECDGPVAVRYPRGAAYDGLQEFAMPVCMGKSEVIKKGTDAALLAVGAMVKTAEEAARILEERGVSVTLVNVRFVKPLDEKLLAELAKTHRLLVTLEDNIKCGGFGERVRDFLYGAGLQTPTEVFAINDVFVEQGAPDELYRALGMDAETVAARVLTRLKG